MNSGRNDRRHISRRVVLAGTALALGATATVVSQTAAQVKISPATANYRDTPKGDQRCDGLRQLPAAECVQIRRRPHQSERLVSAVCQEDVGPPRGRWVGKPTKGLTLAGPPQTRNGAPGGHECFRFSSINVRL